MTPHPLTDQGRQGAPVRLGADHCWAEGGHLFGCPLRVPATDALGLCPAHRTEILGGTP